MKNIYLNRSGGSCGGSLLGGDVAGVWRCALGGWGRCEATPEWDRRPLVRLISGIAGGDNARLVRILTHCQNRPAARATRAAARWDPYLLGSGVEANQRRPPPSHLRPPQRRLQEDGGPQHTRRAGRRGQWPQKCPVGFHMVARSQASVEAFTHIGAGPEASPARPSRRRRLPRWIPDPAYGPSLKAP